MAKDKNIGIRNIKYGEVYLYYPIKLLNNENIDDVKQSIMNNQLIIAEDYFDKMNEHLYQLEKKHIKYIMENNDIFSEVEFYTDEAIDTIDNLDFKCFPEYQINVKQEKSNDFIFTIDSLEEKKFLITYLIWREVKKT